MQVKYEEPDFLIRTHLSDFEGGFFIYINMLWNEFKSGVDILHRYSLIEESRIAFKEFRNGSFIKQPGGN